MHRTVGPFNCLTLAHWFLSVEEAPTKVRLLFDPGPVVKMVFVRSDLVHLPTAKMKPKSSPICKSKGGL